MRIFVVDDEVELTEACALVLEEVGHEAFSLSKTAGVVELAERLHPDLVLVDLVMPSPDGSDDGEHVIRALRSSDAADVAIVAMSALVDGRSRALRAGADGFLPKPFDPDRLERAIEETLARRGRSPRARA